MSWTIAEGVFIGMMAAWFVRWCIRLGIKVLKSIFTKVPQGVTYVGHAAYEKLSQEAAPPEKNQ